MNSNWLNMKCPYQENIKVTNNCPNLLAKVPKQQYVLQNSDLERNTLRLAMVKVKFRPFWIGFMGVGPTPTNSETSKKAIARIFVGQN